MGSDREAEPLARKDILGVVLAGGESRRFGMDKALFPLFGRAMASWALQAMRPWTSSQVVITNSGEVAEALGVPGPARPDSRVGALGWTPCRPDLGSGRGPGGVFLLACDLPLVTGELVGRILGGWPEASMAVVPGSHGPLGFEPLCAGYDVRGLQGLEVTIESREAFDGERSGPNRGLPHPPIRAGKPGRSGCGLYQREHLGHSQVGGGRAESHDSLHAGRPT